MEREGSGTIIRRLLHISGTLKRDAGVTLVEILVAAAVSSLLLVMVYVTYRSVFRTAGDIAEYSEFYENVNMALNRVDRDIRNAVLLRRKEGITLIAEDGGDRDSLHFVTTELRELPLAGRPDTPFPFSDVHEVSYFCESDEKHPDLCVLMRRSELHYDDDTTAGGASHVVIKNVVGLNFEYRYGNDWQDEWDSRDANRFPRAVRVTLTLVDYSGKEETFTKISVPEENRK